MLVTRKLHRHRHTLVGETAWSLVLKTTMDRHSELASCALTTDCFDNTWSTAALLSQTLRHGVICILPVVINYSSIDTISPRMVIGLFLSWSSCLELTEQRTAWTVVNREQFQTGCLPDSPKPDSPNPDSPKIGFRVRVRLRVRVSVSANRVSANRDWTSDSYLKLICLLSTSAYSALEVLHIMRYINLLTYLLTYLLTKMNDLDFCLEVV